MTAEKFTINDTYILKKDLPHVKAGLEFLVKDCHNSDELYLMAINKESFLISQIENFDEWFEKKDRRWKPKYDEMYCYIDFINTILREDFSVHERVSIAQDIDKFNFKIGNVFKNRTDAKFFMNEYLKKAFDKYHEDYPPGSPRG